MQKAKRIVAKVSLAYTPETSKTSLKISFDSSILKQIRLLSKVERKIIGRAIEDVHLAWGHPHVHSGTGLRKLTNTLFECRSGLKDRLVFELLHDDSLHFHMLGNHNAVLKFLKAHR